MGQIDANIEVEHTSPEGSPTARADVSDGAVLRALSSIAADGESDETTVAEVCARLAEQQQWHGAVPHETVAQALFQLRNAGQCDLDTDEDPDGTVLGVYSYHGTMGYTRCCVCVRAR